MNLLFIALLFVAAVAHPADFYETNIKGDRVVIDTLKDVRGEFDPSVTLTKWSEEESLKLTFKHDRKFTSDVKTIDNKVRVTNDNMTVDYYTDDKEFKIIIEFRSRPRTNTYTFDLEGWEN